MLSSPQQEAFKRKSFSFGEPDVSSDFKRRTTIAVAQSSCCPPWVSQLFRTASSWVVAWTHYLPYSSDAALERDSTSDTA